MIKKDKNWGNALIDKEEPYKAIPKKGDGQKKAVDKKEKGKKK